MSALPPIADIHPRTIDVRFVPCVDGSELARAFFTFAALVGGHVFGLLVRHMRPLAIMPCADQVPVNSTHSTMRWQQVGCPDRRIDRLRITCCSPSQPSHHAGGPTRSRLRRKRDGLLVALASGHHRPDHARNLVGQRDGCDLGRPPRQQCREPRPAALLTPVFTAARFIPTTTVRLQCTDLSGRNGSYG